VFRNHVDDEVDPAVGLRHHQHVGQETHPCAVGPEQALEGEVHLHILGDIEENAPAPQGGVEGGQAVFIRAHALRHEVLAHELRIFPHGGRKVGEDHPFVLQRRIQVNVDRIRVFLHDDVVLLHVGRKEGLYRFRQGLQAVQGRRLGHGLKPGEIPPVDPGFLHPGQIETACGLKGVETKLAHPIGLSMFFGQLVHRFLVKKNSRIHAHCRHPP